MLQEALDMLPPNHVVIIERANTDAMEKCHYDWFHETLDMESAIDVLPNCELRLVRVKSGKNIGRLVILTASFFISFAENVSTEQRMNNSHVDLVLLALLHASGIVEAEAVARLQRLTQSFLMALSSKCKTDAEATDFDTVDADYFDTNDADDVAADADAKATAEARFFRKARILAFPNGYFAGNAKRVVTVSRQLKIGYAELLYLRVELGYEKFNVLVGAFGLQTPTPLELDWVCPGLPASPTISVEPCTAVAEGIHLDVYMVGRMWTSHPFYGHFLCNRCRVNLHRRELASTSP